MTLVPMKTHYSRNNSCWGTPLASLHCCPLLGSNYLSCWHAVTLVSIRLISKTSVDCNIVAPFGNCNNEGRIETGPIQKHKTLLLGLFNLCPDSLRLTKMRSRPLRWLSHINFFTSHRSDIIKLNVMVISDGIVMLDYRFSQVCVWWILVLSYRVALCRRPGLCNLGKRLVANALGTWWLSRCKL